MLFNSLTYAIFLIVIFAAYWIIPNKYRKWILLIASYYFYMSWNIKYVSLILYTTLLSYFAARLMENREKKQKKTIMAIAATLCLVVLFVFKYLDFTLNSLNEITQLFSLPMHFTTYELIIPVGISFYSFQTLSYIIDVYRGDITAEKDFITYAVFVSFFPQLVAGPIERSRNLLPQFNKTHEFNTEKALDGFKLMIWGYFEKLVIADNVASYVDAVYNNVRSYKGLDFAIVILFFTVQIYCDFSGYSNIAIGTAKLLDIDLMTNFKSPYLADSIKEFWNRWHISLSTWFRDYVYIPLGGNRCGRVRKNINVLITFLVSGLWHGAGWTFVAWGGLHGIMQIVEDAFSKSLHRIRQKRISHYLSILIVFIFCNIAWVFFRAETFSDAAYVIIHVFDNILVPSAYFHTDLIKRNKFIMIIIYLLILLIYDINDYNDSAIQRLSKQNRLVQWSVYIFIGLIVIFCSQKNAPAEFVYFQF